MAKDLQEQVKDKVKIQFFQFDICFFFPILLYQQIENSFLIIDKVY